MSAQWAGSGKSRQGGFYFKFVHYAVVHTHEVLKLNSLRYDFECGREIFTLTGSILFSRGFKGPESYESMDN